MKASSSHSRMVILFLGKGYKGVKPDKTFLNMRKTGSHKTLPKDTTT